MSIIDKIFFWRNWGKHETPENKKPADNKPVEPKDTVDINTGDAAPAKDTEIQKPQPPVVEEKGLTLEHINTPLEVAVVPIADPGLLSTVAKAIMSDRILSAKGSIKQGDKKYDVELDLQKTGKGQYDYNLNGKLGDMEIGIHCFRDGLSLLMDGSIGDNPVKVKNKYSIMSGG